VDDVVLGNRLRFSVLNGGALGFAIAAGLATAAFGASAAAPLGLYGVLVLLWGTGAAGWLRKR